jgi:hypothetical protein
MKQFIVLMAVLPIMLIFMLQFTLDQKNSLVVARIQDVTYAAKEEAKQEGFFSPEIKERLKKNIGRATGINPERIIVESEDSIKLRYAPGNERLIYYRVEVPIEGVMAGSGLLGISKEENRYIYVIDSYTASEKI